MSDASDEVPPAQGGTDDAPQRSDAEPDDPRRRSNPFAPPTEPCECYCLHCQRFFMSSEIWLQKVINAEEYGMEGHWMCPTPNCDGRGFTFDIWPTDPSHPDSGWSWDDEEYDEDDFDENGELIDEADREYNPDEPKYKRLDEEYGEEGDDDDIEGEEWKYGLSPGEQLPEPQWAQNAREEWEEEQKRYDGPDLRPREVYEPVRERPRGNIRDEDLPF